MNEVIELYAHKLKFKYSSRKIFQVKYFQERYTDVYLQKTFTGRLLYNSKKCSQVLLKKNNKEKKDPQIPQQPFLYVTHFDGSSNASDTT